MSRNLLENVVGAPSTFILDALIWSAGALVLYLYGVRGTGGW